MRVEGVGVAGLNSDGVGFLLHLEGGVDLVDGEFLLEGAFVDDMELEGVGVFAMLGGAGFDETVGGYIDSGVQG